VRNRLRRVHLEEPVHRASKAVRAVFGFFIRASGKSCENPVARPIYPLNSDITLRELEEVESAIFADYRDSGGLRGTIKMGRRRNQGQVGDPLSVRPRAKGRQGAQRKGFVTWSID
jgi:hypothetical protein